MAIGGRRILFASFVLSYNFSLVSLKVGDE